MESDKVVKVVREWTEFEDLQILQFDKAAIRYREIMDLEKKLKVEKDELSKDILAAMYVSGEKTLGLDDLIVITANGRTAGHISAHLLVQAGVDADLVAECTEQGKSYQYIQVKRKGEKGDKSS